MKSAYLESMNGRSLFRHKQRLELLCLYLFCFGLLGFLSYAEIEGSTSEILADYLKFLTKYKLQIVIILSLVVPVAHYQMLLKARTEVSCRVVVGDTLLRIKTRYLTECFVVLGVASFVSFICFPLSTSDALNLNGLLALYAIASLVFVRGHGSL